MWLYPLPSIIAFVGFTYIFISSGVEAICLGLAWLVAGTIFFTFWAKSNHEWPFAAVTQSEAA
jgi:hypothetical protein